MGEWRVGGRVGESPELEHGGNAEIMKTLLYAEARRE